jgi:hypothetical protein
MTPFRLTAALALTLGLAACERPTAPDAAPATPTAPAAAAAEPAAPRAMPVRLFLAPNGLDTEVVASGARQLMAFSRTKSQVLVTMTRVEPAPGLESENGECGAGPMDFAAWPDGLTLMFQEGRFVGWSADEAGLTTTDGLGVGSTRAQLLAVRPAARIEESTLGMEFSVGEMGGLLDGPGPDAKITTLWAGVTCMFR